jgi:SPP1 family predicted phage head-tail adaptor
LNAGELRNLLTIQRPVRATGDYGAAETTTWTDVGQVWAGVRPLRALEKIRSQQPAQETDFIVKCRFTTAITADCRLLWPQRAGGNRTLYISGIIDVNGRQVELEIMCSEREVTNA